MAAGSAQRGFGARRQLGESRLVVDRQFGEDFAVHFNARQAEPANQAAVVQPVGARRGVDAHHPQLAELALALAAVAVGVLQRARDRLLRRAEGAAARAAVAARGFEDFFVARPRYGALSDSRHDGYR